MELTKDRNRNVVINEEKVILRERRACTQEIHVNFSERKSYLRDLTIAIYMIYVAAKVIVFKAFLQNLFS